MPRRGRKTIHQAGIRSPKGPYEWLNSGVFVGTLEMGAGGMTDSLLSSEVTFPPPDCVDRALQAACEAHGVAADYRAA